jgi:hypothetical protein
LLEALAIHGTVQSSISYSLGANTENLILLVFAKPEKGLVDGKAVMVYGYPKCNELDYMQGEDDYLLVYRSGLSVRINPAFCKII